MYIRIMKATITDLQRELWLRRRNNSEIVWTTKDGTEIPINKMSDQHIENAIKRLIEIENFEEIALEYDAYVSKFE